MAFSVFVEMLNLKMKSKTNPIAMRNRFADDKLDDKEIKLLDT
ncbi:MAG: hypothetical protein WBH40_15195 [Ignavibacteriaceae bacterium]